MLKSTAFAKFDALVPALTQRPLTLVTVVAVGSALAGGLWAWWSPQTLPPPLVDVAVSLPADRAIVARTRPVLVRPVTIVLLGVDRLPERSPNSPQRFEGNGDTLALLRLDPQARSLKLVSIPRDTPVEIPGYGVGKINRANRLGGAALTVASLNNLLGEIGIDRVLRVDVAALRQVIDQVGGLELYIEPSMRYVDRAQGLTIDLEPGWQFLNGDQVVQFASYRDNDLGDIGRVQRQQQVFEALGSRLRHPATVRHLPELVAIVQDAVDTDLSGRELLAIARGVIEAETVEAVMLPGQFAQAEDGGDPSDWLPDRAGIDRIRRQFLLSADAADDFVSDPGTRRQVSLPSNLRVVLHDATGRAIDLEALGDRLRQLNGATVQTLSPSDRLRRKTAIVSQTGDLGVAQALRSRLGCGTAAARSTGTLDADVTIYIGLDCLEIVTEPQTD